MCIDPNGKVIYYKPNDEDLYTFSINKKEVTEARASLPFLKDGDSFTVTDQ
jgi:predicted amidohydrolase